MRNNKVLITGATGYVGRRVVAILLAMGRPVRVLVHAHTTEEILPSGIEKIEGDIFDVVSLNRACDGVGSVIHLAAVVREKGPNTFMSVNLEGTINLLESASNMGVERFIFASTIGATSDTAIPYLNSRWMAEQEIINKGMLYTIVRFSVGFGKGDEFFTILASQAKLFPLIPLAGTGANRFQPIAVDDVAKCLVVALNRDEFIGETVEAGGIKCYTYDQLVDLVARTLDVRISKLHIPLQVIKPIDAQTSSYYRADQNDCCRQCCKWRIGGKKIWFQSTSAGGELGLLVRNSTTRRPENESWINAYTCKGLLTTMCYDLINK